ncbi:citrate lyase subunit alpha [Proteiniclasticum sp. C24MP]|uniref:citrate lyase subunit alpha n=1 Tax=Proteiniclasticum sp. C24MP TaxID=3374101 RepID=UPI003754DED1
MRNSIGREGLDRPYEGPFKNVKAHEFVSPKKDLAKRPVFSENLDEVLDKLDLHDGMTVSFHHHMRNGDYVLPMVMEKLHERGIKNMTVAATSLFPCHACLVPMFEDETVTKVLASYISGPVGVAISTGKVKEICHMTTHGGRPRSMLEGEVVVDVAFIAAPAVDANGSLTGSEGPASCGVLGYAHADAETAKQVVAITDYTAETVNQPEIPGHLVDYVVKVDSIGDPKGIVSGTTQITKDPVGLKIARDAAKLIEHSGLLNNGMSFQTGAGGISLAVANELKKIMKEKKITGSFASGGITDYLVNLLKEGYFEKLYDVQCFNLDAVESIKVNENHIKMSAHTYANINNPDNIVNKLDVVILGASEIDLDFNVNVTTGSDGIILGGSGGHADTAAGSKLSIIVSKLVNSRISCLVDEVTTVTTPGETVDVLVTDRGIAINPKHKELIDKLKEETSLKIMDIHELKKIADFYTGIAEKRGKSDQIVAVSEYRDGTILDAIYKV